MVFSLMPHDLDRSVLSVRIGQKPYFELVDGRLELRGVPVEPSAEAYFANHPPRIRSYLWAMLVHSRALPGPVGTFLRGDVATLARKREINCAILASAALELQHPLGVELRGQSLGGEAAAARVVPPHGPVAGAKGRSGQKEGDAESDQLSFSI